MGYIWIATQNGLNRYNGYECTLYGSSFNSNDDGLKGKSITSLYEDKQGNLWVGTAEQGISIKYFGKKEFVHLENKEPFLKIKGYAISKFTEDKLGNIWIATINGGLLKYNTQSQTSQNYTAENAGLLRNEVFDVVIDKQGAVWLVTAGEGIHVMKDDQHFELKGQNAEQAIGGYRKCLYYEHPNMWIGCDDVGLFRYNILTENIKQFNSGNASDNLSSNSIRTILQWDQDNLLIGTDGGGINILNTKTNDVQVYQSIPNDPTSINSNAILTTMKDNEDNLWIGTFNGGVNIFTRSKVWFDILNKKNSAINNQSILSVVQKKDGNILIATDGAGLYELDKNDLSKIIKHYKHNDNETNSLNGDLAKTVMEAKDGKIWIGMYRYGMDVYDPKTNQYQHFNPEIQNDVSNFSNIWSIIERLNEEVWIGTLGEGINITDSNLSPSKRLLSNPYDTLTLKSNVIMVLFEDKNETVWVGTAQNGLSKWSDLKETFTHYVHNPEDSLSISNNEIRAIYQDSKGKLWIGTEGGGINLWNGDNTFEKIKIEDGLLSNNIMGITEDNNGDLWVTSYRGISKINTQTLEIKNFDFHSAERNNQFNQMSILATANGRLYFGGINGLNSIIPNSLSNIVDQGQKPVLTSLKILDQEIDNIQGRKTSNLPIEKAEDIILNYYDKSITLEFTAFDFSHAEEKSYAYKLEGFDTEWQRTKKGENRLTYTNLDPGQYKLNVKYNNQERVINIDVKPPFWKTWWFQFCMILLALLLFTFSFRYYNEKQESAFQKELLIKEKEILSLKNKNLESDINDSNTKLLSSTAQMVRKNEFLIEIKSDLKQEVDNKTQQTRKLVNKIERELESEDYWTSFKYYFDKVDSGFVSSIIAKFPDLTQNDIKLCSLIRINLSTKEIASIMNISVRGVEKSRYRLKKRLNLSSEQSLTKFIRTY